MTQVSYAEIVALLEARFTVEPDPEFVRSILLAVEAAQKRADLRATIQACPVCQSPAEMTRKPDWAITCSKCGIQLPRFYAYALPDHTTESVMISRWNALPRNAIGFVLKEKAE